MKPHFLYITTTATSLLLLCLLRCSSSQIIGCDSPNVDCPTKGSAADGGICSVDNGDIGVVSFDSNVSSSGPLTWTITQANDEGGNTLEPYASRTFWLGTPPQLDFQTVTDWAACSMFMANITSALSAPADFDDFDNFGCSTVLGDDCSADILSRVREEFASILDEGFPDYNPDVQQSPCVSVLLRLEGVPLPETCDIQVEDKTFKFGAPRSKFIFPSSEGKQPLISDTALTNNTEGVTFWYQDQDECSMTTGGPEYHIVNGAEEKSFNNFNGADLNGEIIQRFRNGTTPLFTFFYNEPWDTRTTGPARFLAEPEVHLHCLRTLPSTSEEYASESAGGQIRSGYLWMLLPIVGVVFGV